MLVLVRNRIVNAMCNGIFCLQLRWLFALLIFVELLTITIQLSFPNNNDKFPFWQQLFTLFYYVDICLNIDHYFHNSINRFCGLVLFMVFYTTFNNISVILLRSVLLVEETGVLVENHWPAASHWKTLSHNVVSSTPRHERGMNSQLQWW